MYLKALEAGASQVVGDPSQGTARSLISQYFRMSVPISCPSGNSLFVFDMYRYEAKDSEHERRRWPCRKEEQSIQHIQVPAAPGFHAYARRTDQAVKIARIARTNIARTCRLYGAVYKKRAREDRTPGIVSKTTVSGVETT